MPRVVHFEIHADDTARAVRFYVEVFDWKVVRWGGEDYWLVTTGDAGQPGINGGLLPRRGPRPTEGQAVSSFVCTIEVDDLDVYVARAEANGGKIAVPKMPIPGVGWLSYCHDTEGNIFGMTQPDPTAK